MTKKRIKYTALYMGFFSIFFLLQEAHAQPFQFTQFSKSPEQTKKETMAPRLSPHLSQQPSFPGSEKVKLSPVSKESYLFTTKQKPTVIVKSSIMPEDGMDFEMKPEDWSAELPAEKTPSIKPSEKAQEAQKIMPFQSAPMLEEEAPVAVVPTAIQKNITADAKADETIAKAVKQLEKINKELEQKKTADIVLPAADTPLTSVPTDKELDQYFDQLTLALSEQMKDDSVAVMNQTPMVSAPSAEEERMDFDGAMQELREEIGDTPVPAPSEPVEIQPAPKAVPVEDVERVDLKDAVGLPPSVVADLKTETSPTPATSALESKTITFEKEKNTLTSESMKIIDDIANKYKKDPHLFIRLTGYSSLPNAVDARRLSYDRVFAVRSQLLVKGVNSSQTYAMAMGNEFGQGNPDRVDIQFGKK